MDIASLTNTVTELAANADVLGSTVKIAFNDAEGVILIDGTGDSNVVSNEATDAECTIKVDQADLSGMLDGSLNPMMAFTMGKLAIEGDMGAAMKLSALFG